MLGEREYRTARSPLAALVFDSSREVRVLTSIILGKVGFDVEHALSMSIALDKLEHRFYAVILVEASPAEDRSPLFELAPTRPDVLSRVLALTSIIPTSQFLDDLARMKLSGIVGKPFDVRELVDAAMRCAMRSQPWGAFRKNFRPSVQAR